MAGNTPDKNRARPLLHQVLRHSVTRLVLVVLVVMGVLATIAVGRALAFPDVPHDRPDYRAITWLEVNGAARGFADGTFRPDYPAIRAEFVKMVVAAMFLPPQDTSDIPFQDVEPGGVGGPYPGGYIAAAYLRGMVKGKSSRVFDPYGPLTRAQAMTIAARTAAELRARDFRPLPNDYRGRFADFDDPVHGESAKLAEANHLLAGIDLDGWDPWATATRSEAATIAWNLVNCFG